MRTWISVKIPADVLVLDQHFDVHLEPPYWHLRCWHCEQTWFLPWDPVIRTQTAVQALLDHGRACCPEGHQQRNSA
jgi:hypothetical protein